MSIRKIRHKHTIFNKRKTLDNNLRFFFNIDVLTKERNRKMNSKEKIEAIHNGVMTEKYEEWKTSKTQAVRAELASKGYFPEHFINDETTYVRRAVVRKHPEYYAQLLTHPNNDSWVLKDIMSEMFNEPNLTNETIEVAMDMIKSRPALFNMGSNGVSIYNKLLERKRMANNKEISVLEASMSPAQLFSARNDIWCKSYSVMEIHRIDNLRGIKHHNVEELELLFRRENLNDYQKYVKLTREYRIRRRAEEKARNRKVKKNAKEIIEAIRNGEMNEKYDEWKNHKTHAIRAQLAKSGYFPEHFINDSQSFIRRIVPRNYPEYYAQALDHPSNNGDDMRIIMRDIFHEPNVTDEVIESAITHLSKQNAIFGLGRTGVAIYCQILERKRTANHHPVSLLEAGMSNAQLFAVNNDLWCKSYSVSEIRILDDLRKVNNHNVHELESLFDRKNMKDLSKYREMLRQYRMRRYNDRKEKDENRRHCKSHSKGTDRRKLETQ